MIGGVLTERTVAEVLPAIQENMTKVCFASPHVRAYLIIASIVSNVKIPVLREY
jgi:hypothetical protein